MKKIKSNLRPVLIGVAFGLVLGILMQFLEEQQIVSEINLITLFMALVISLIIHIVIHELGHLGAGLLSGYEFSSFRIGSLMWMKEDGKMKLRRYKIKGTGGQCLMVPPGEFGEDYPVIFYNLGGVLMNIITSAILVIPAIMLGSIEMIVFIIAGLMSALMNGIPMQSGGISNDGRNALELSKSVMARKFFYVQLKSNALLMQGVRMKDMPDEWFMLPEDSDLGNIHICTMLYLQANRLVDMGKYQEAEEWIEWTLKNAVGMIEMYRLELRCECMYLKIILDKCEEAEALYTEELAKYIRATSFFMSRRRLMYAYYHLIKKDGAKAERELQAFEKIKKTHPYKADLEMEEELIEEVERKLKW